MFKVGIICKETKEIYISSMLKLYIRKSAFGIIFITRIRNFDLHFFNQDMRIYY